MPAPRSVAPRKLPSSHAQRAARPIAQTCAAAALAALALGACSSSAATPAAKESSAAECRAPEAPVLPQAAGSLTQRDSGSYCLPAGQSLDVFLTTPDGTPAGVRWSRIAVRDTTVVGYGNSGVLTAPVNVTPGIFIGVHAGSTTLSSSLPDGTTWHATVVVR
jgi:hypothetical protein